MNFSPVPRLIAELRRPRPLLRAAVELANAANGFRPLARKGYLTIAVFWVGWPTSELPAFYAAGSMIDATRRGLRGDFRGRRGIAALALTVLSWGFLAGRFHAVDATVGGLNGFESSSSRASAGVFQPSV